MSVWKSDEKLLSFVSLISPSEIILFEKQYQAFDTVFHHQMKHLEVCQKYSTACCIFNSLLGVLIIRWWNTLSYAWYITSKYDSFHIISIHNHYFKSVLLFISLLRWFVAYQSAMSFRFSHYFVSFLSECTSLLSGIGTEVNQEGKQLTLW